MKITILGGTGWLGAEIALEAINRKHEVVIISRHPEDIKYTLTPDLPSLKADVSNIDELRNVIPNDTEVLINSTIPDPFNHGLFKGWCQNIVNVCKEKNIPLLIGIGDSSIFSVTKELKLNQTTFLTPFYRTWFSEHEESHEVYKASNINWLEIVPAAKCLPDKQLKDYLISEDCLCSIDELVTKLEVKDPDHYPFGDTSYISTQDFAYAVLEEIENKKYRNTRICVCWKEKHEMY